MATERIKIDYAGCETSYGRGTDPDGNGYDYINGVYVRAQGRGSDENGGYTRHFVYKGLDGCDGQHECFTEEGGADLAGRIVEKGSIDPDLWWECNRDYDNAVPDYVTSWWREEYN